MLKRRSCIRDFRVRLTLSLICIGQVPQTVHRRVFKIAAHAIVLLAVA
jgi:hypothetical protein